MVGRNGLLCLLQQAGFNIFQYAAQENSFGQFMPDVLYNGFAFRYTVGSELQTILENILATTATTKTIATGTALADTAQAATTMPVESKFETDALQSSISLVLEYLPDPILFAYPDDGPVLSFDIANMKTTKETATAADASAATAAAAAPNVEGKPKSLPG